MVPQNHRGLPIDVSLHSLEKGFAAPFVAHRIKITLHLVEEFLFIDVAIQLSQNFLTSVVSYPVMILVC